MHAEFRAQRRPVAWLKQVEVDAVAQWRNARTVYAQRDHFILERIADRDHAGGLAGRPAYHPPRQAILWNQIDVRAARGNNNRLVEIAPQHDRSNAIRIKIVSVDDVEVITFINSPGY